MYKKRADADDSAKVNIDIKNTPISTNVLEVNPPVTNLYEIIAHITSNANTTAAANKPTVNLILLLYFCFFTGSMEYLLIKLYIILLKIL